MELLQHLVENKEFRRDLLAVVIVSLFLLAAATGVIQVSVNFGPKSQTQTEDPLKVSPAEVGITPCSYVIFIVSGVTTAMNCGPGANTGVVLDRSTNAAGVINDAIGNLTGGGEIFIKAGTYTLTTTAISLTGNNVASIGCDEVTGTCPNNIELYGEGNSTILMAGTNLDATLIAVVASGWYIHDLQLNGLATESGKNLPSGENGIQFGDQFKYITQYVKNDRVERTYVQGSKTFGITMFVNNGQILNNLIVNSNANGISVQGSNYLIQGNVVNGASDVGISISGTSASQPITNVVCIGNIVENIDLGDSPFDSSAFGSGISAGDNAGAQNVTITSNFFINTQGVESDPNAGGVNIGITISDNSLVDMIGPAFSTAIGIGDPSSYVHVVDNTIDMSTDLTYGIFEYPGCSSVVISGNTISGALGSAVSSYDIYVQAEGTIVTGNTLTGLDNPIILNTVSNVLVEGNYFHGSSSTSNYGIQLVNASFSTIEGNMLDGNNYNGGGIGVYLSNSTNNIISDNMISNVTVGVDFSNSASDSNSVLNNNLNDTSTKIYNSASANLILGNAGYNPIGAVAHFVATSNHYISPFGTSATIVKSITYMITVAPVLIIFRTTGTATSVMINGGTGFTPTIGESFILYPGETIDFGAFTTAPSLEVSFS
jgi:hypothetical protein